MTLYERMKENYEYPYNFRLTKRTPVIIRIDGKAFRTFTKHFGKPFDPILTHAMQLTMLELCKNIQGATFGYTQSDEISILLQDYENLETSAWFDYEVQKLCSVSASMATLYFNKFFKELVAMHSVEGEKHHEARLKAAFEGALFDARCFNLPKEEVANYFISRQSDAIRNSIQMVGQAYFTHKELNRKSLEDIKKMLKEKNIDWAEYSTSKKRGTACYKAEEWNIDYTTPLFTEDREYIEKYV